MTPLLVRHLQRNRLFSQTIPFCFMVENFPSQTNTSLWRKTLSSKESDTIFNNCGKTFFGMEAFSLLPSPYIAKYLKIGNSLNRSRQSWKVFYSYCWHAQSRLVNVKILGLQTPFGPRSIQVGKLLYFYYFRLSLLLDD